MVEYTEDDIARELEELRLQETDRKEGQAGGANMAEVDGVPVVLPAGPRRRGPPRRKNASANLNVMPEESKGEDGE